MTLCSRICFLLCIGSPEESLEGLRIHDNSSPSRFVDIFVSLPGIWASLIFLSNKVLCLATPIIGLKNHPFLNLSFVEDQDPDLTELSLFLEQIF